MLDAGLKTKHSRSFLPVFMSIQYLVPLGGISSIHYKTITTKVLQKLDINFKILAYIDSKRGCVKLGLSALLIV